MDEHPWSYGTWSSHLADFFFKEGDAQLPTTFSVDDRALGKLTGLTASAAAERLAAVVRQRVMPGFRFDAVVAESQQWQRAGAEGAPPGLPLLAVSVLAASRMGGDDLHHLDFYRPFRRLLDPRDTSAGMPPGFDECFPKLWEQLKWWLDEHLSGSRGQSTVYRHEHWTLIGYSLQQAIFRTSDRRRVQQFLASTGFRAGDDFEPAELRRSLEIWSSRRGSDADRLRRLSTDSNLRPYCEELLAHIASSWDGTLRDVSSGMPVSHIRLALERGLRPSLRAVATWDERMPEAATVSVKGHDVKLEQWERKYFAPLPLPHVDTVDLLHGSVRYAGETVSLQFEHEDVFALALNDELGGWSSVDNINYGETYCLLVNPSVPGLRAAVQTFCERECEKPAELQPSATQRMHGWFLFTNFRLEARPRGSTPKALAHLLRTGGGSRLGLVGGLPLPQQRHLYLTGGAPLLALPAEYDLPDFVVRQRRDRQDMTFRVQPGNEYPLYSLQLSEGGYDVLGDTATVSFDLVEGLAGRHRQRDGVGDVDGFCVAGAKRPLPVQIPLAVENGSCVVIGAGSKNVAMVSAPRWIEERAGFLSWRNIDAWIDFEPVWRIETERGNWVAHPMSHVEPDAGSVVSATDSWGRCLRRSDLVAGCNDEIQALWKRYVAASEGNLS